MFGFIQRLKDAIKRERENSWRRQEQELLKGIDKANRKMSEVRRDMEEPRPHERLMPEGRDTTDES